MFGQQKKEKICDTFENLQNGGKVTVTLWQSVLTRAKIYPGQFL